MWVWAHRWLPGTVYTHWLIGAVVVPGRCWTAAVESWIVIGHIKALLAADALTARQNHTFSGNLSRE